MGKRNPILNLTSSFSSPPQPALSPLVLILPINPAMSSVIGDEPVSSASCQSLPFEIVCEIVSYITSQSALHTTACISRRFNIAATPLLYEHPRLTASNIDAFVASVAPTVYPPPRKAATSSSAAEHHLADFVRTLDLSFVLYTDTLRTATARLLTHCRLITRFVGPQKSFTGIALRALRHSTALTQLDLRACQETCDLPDFFHVLNYLPRLTVLHFPRSALFSSPGSRQSRVQYSTHDTASISPGVTIDIDINVTVRTQPLPTALRTTFSYPENLDTLTVSGGIIDSTLLASGTPPTSISSFAISHLPFVRMTAVRQYIHMLAPQLTRLSVLHPIPHLPHNFLDRILVSCPQLTHLTASVDFLTAHIFDEENCAPDHPLERIDLDCSGGMGSEFKISSDDISIALMEGRLKRLRVVRASVKLGWGRRGDEMRRVKDLAELLCMDRSGFGEEDDDEDLEGECEICEVEADPDAEADETAEAEAEAEAEADAEEEEGEDAEPDAEPEVIEPAPELTGRERNSTGEEDNGKMAGVWLF
ncbi:hypothetical protein ABW21_db0209540 [Orbilia brochopaga]|nr:hypothetical protein ABW21_db0209540 [Drechslerella brochopaga]